MAFFTVFNVNDASAFALLGPYAPWMEETNGFRLRGDIGGPMDMGRGYRWNVPVITYGFDPSFVSYFGTNGVAAVEGAIQILNNLPPASQMNLTNYSYDLSYQNLAATAASAQDLRSETLGLLLEHLGLAQPERYVYALKQWNTNLLDSYQAEWTNGVIPNFIVQLNFDPQTLEPTNYVNGALYLADLESGNGYNFVDTFPAEVFADSFTSVAGQSQYLGDYFTGLTYDDVGGLCYLLATNNVNFESFPAGVTGAGTNGNSFVNGAWRGGVDKITFVPQPVDLQSGAFLPYTNCFTDTYLTNGTRQTQRLMRVASQPDFLFTVQEINSGMAYVPYFSRTGTTNWINNAAANGNSDGEGPGVIQPPVTITFNRLGGLWATAPTFSDEDAVEEPFFWGSFDGTTNVTVVYPIPVSGTNYMTVRIWLDFMPSNDANSAGQQSFEWTAASPAGSMFVVQTTTNLVDWVTLFAVPNNNNAATFIAYSPNSRQRYYRLVPQ